MAIRPDWWCAGGSISSWRCADCSATVRCSAPSGKTSPSADQIPKDSGELAFHTHLEPHPPVKCNGCQISIGAETRIRVRLRRQMHLSFNSSATAARASRRSAASRPSMNQRRSIWSCRARPDGRFLGGARADFGERLEGRVSNHKSSPRSMGLGGAGGQTAFRYGVRVISAATVRWRQAKPPVAAPVLRPGNFLLEAAVNCSSADRYSDSSETVKIRALSFDMMLFPNGFRAGSGFVRGLREDQTHDLIVSYLASGSVDSASIRLAKYGRRDSTPKSPNFDFTSRWVMTAAPCHWLAVSRIRMSASLPSENTAPRPPKRFRLMPN